MKTIFLPGAGGSANFWRPVADRLALVSNMNLLSWPGLGAEPPDENVRGLDDLVNLTLSEIDSPSALVAQSMGGLVAALCALKRPESVRRLVLVATSAGLPVEEFGASDWRPGYRAAFPAAALWIEEVRIDLSRDLPSIEAPTLLIWGDRDPISPVAIGRKLAQLAPRAEFHVVAGGDHDLAIVHAEKVARLIDAHLASN